MAARAPMMASGGGRMVPGVLGEGRRRGAVRRVPRESLLAKAIAMLRGVERAERADAGRAEPRASRDNGQAADQRTPLGGELLDIVEKALNDRAR